MKELEEKFEKLPEAKLLKAIFLDKEFYDSCEIESIYINEKEKRVTIKFKDGYISKVKCLEGDTFNIHYGVALAFLKAYYSRNNIVDIINSSCKKTIVKLDAGMIKLL